MPSSPESLSLHALTERLRAAGCVRAEDEAVLILADGRDAVALVERRVAGEPLEQVLGWAGFAGRRYAVRPGVFVPRPRSVLLAAAAVEALPPGGVLVDLCCGVGAITGAVLDRVPDAQAWAVDLDPVAVACARENLPGVRVLEGDLDAPLPRRLRRAVDVLVANAPYVPTAEVDLLPHEARDHESRVALDGGADGLAVHRRIAAAAPTWLAPDGVLLVEVAEAQASVLADVYARRGLRASVREEDGTAVVSGRREGRTAADRAADLPEA
ncbi:putative protein N(5)-glutamine methyltransferase [Alteromonas gracilis]